MLSVLSNPGTLWGFIIYIKHGLKLQTVRLGCQNIFIFRYYLHINDLKFQNLFYKYLFVFIIYKRMLPLNCGLAKQILCIYLKISLNLNILVQCTHKHLQGTCLQPIKALHVVTATCKINQGWYWMFVKKEITIESSHSLWTKTFLQALHKSSKNGSQTL